MQILERTPDGQRIPFYIHDPVQTINHPLVEIQDDDDRWNLKFDSTEEDPSLRWQPSLVGIRISVATLAGGNIYLDGSPWDTIKTVRQHIKRKAGIPLDQQRLFFEGRLLEDDHTMVDYSIQDGSTLQLIHRPRPRVTKIFVSCNNEKIITLSVELSNTIRSVKIEIEQEEHISINQQRLFFEGKQLDDCWTLADYNIHFESTIHLVLPRRCLLMW